MLPRFDERSTTQPSTLSPDSHSVEVHLREATCGSDGHLRCGTGAQTRRCACLCMTSSTSPSTTGAST
eukprot:3732094-Rhodomonas_salina.2